MKNTIEIIEPASPWQHIRPIGEDIVQEEMLFPQGHKIRPVDIGVLLSLTKDRSTRYEEANCKYHSNRR